MELLKKDRGADIKAGLFMGASNTWAVVWERIIECVFSALERKGWGAACLQVLHSHAHGGSSSDGVSSCVQQVRRESCRLIAKTCGYCRRV